MTRLLTTGYETGNINEAGTSNVASFGTLTVVSSTPTPRTGAYCLKAATTAASGHTAYKNFDLGATKTEVWVRFAFLAQWGATSGSIAFMMTSTSVAQGALTYHGVDGLLRLYSGHPSVGGTLIATSGTSFSQGTWHLIEWRTQLLTASTGVSEVWLDGARVINFSGDNSGSGTLDIRSIQLGILENLGINGLYSGYDDIAINDTAGAVDNGRPGDVPPENNPYSALEAFTYGGLEAYTYGQLEHIPVATPLTVSTTQAQTASLTFVYTPGGPPAPTTYPISVNAAQAQTVSLSRAVFVVYELTVSATQAQSVSLSFVEVAPLVVRRVSSVITFAGVELTDVLSARGQVAADSGWPTCSVFVTAKPETGNEEDDLEVVAGAGTNVIRFTGKLRRFKPSAFPKGIEVVGTGTLAYAAEWAPDTDLLFDEEFPSGATDQTLVAWALGFVPGVSYVGANIEGTGITLGTEAPEAFDWHAGVSAWQYVQQLDQATLYRTYQASDGTIYRTQMIGHPSSTTTTFTLANQDILEGSTGSRNTEQTRNAVIVRGHDYGNDLGPTLGTAYGANDFQGDGATAATRHPEAFSSDLIEDGNDEDGTPIGYGGLDAQDIADAILNDVNKEFVTADIRSWRDDAHGPGLTCLLDTVDRLAIGEKMWVQGYSWEVDDGWSVTYSLSGGGLEQAYDPGPV